MKLIKANLLTAVGPYNHVAFTGNAETERNGHLIMGAGVAKAFAQAYPSLPRLMGQDLRDRECVGRRYGLAGGFMFPDEDSQHSLIWSLQTKIKWRDPSPLDLVIYSLEMLRDWAEDETWAIAFPGIGKGGLERGKVLPHLEKLGDNVSVFEL